MWTEMVAVWLLKSPRAPKITKKNVILFYIVAEIWHTGCSLFFFFMYMCLHCDEVFIH